MIRVVESELVGKTRACGRCDEHTREANLIQSSLVPQQGLCHGSVEIACRYIPLFDVGGDFADFFVLPNGHIGIYLGDVVGKGLPAAMYSALVMGVLRGVHKTGTDTANVLARLNDRLIQRPISGRFCSTFYALFDPATAELIFSNAGMELPLLAGQGDCRQLGDGGLPSGMFPGAAYSRHVVQLAPGDCVLFATDGLHDLRDRNGLDFSSAQMHQVWAQCAEKSAADAVGFLFERLMTFSAGAAANDDITAIVLKVLP